MVVVMRTEKKVSEETVYGRAGSPASCQCNGRLRFVTPDERPARACPDQRQPSLPSAQLIINAHGAVIRLWRGAVIVSVESCLRRS